MKSLLKNRLNDQKGFTLIELLAVIVILGIILAIAIPAVSSLINNSRIDAHISNAQQFESSAKLYFADNPTDTEVTLSELETGGLLEPMDDPHDRGYDGDNSVVTVNRSETPHVYTTKLVSVGEGESAVTYLGGKSASDYDRDDFENPTTGS